MKDIHIFLVVSTVVLTGYIALLRSIALHPLNDTYYEPKSNLRHDSIIAEESIAAEKHKNIDSFTVSTMPASILKTDFKSNFTSFSHFPELRQGVIILGMHRSGTSGT